MRIGLFIPCYINQFYPNVAFATLELLEKQDFIVEYPVNQTCCGQPMANSGFEQLAKKTYKLFIENFHSYDYIVSPSASCVYHIRKHYDVLPQIDEVKQVIGKTYELSEFLVKVIHKKDFNSEFKYIVGFHSSRYGLCGLHLGKPSEIVDDYYPIPNQLLNNVRGIKLIHLDRADECCGFGGAFAVTEEAVSVKAGNDWGQSALYK